MVGTNFLVLVIRLREELSISKKQKIIALNTDLIMLNLDI
jgi:hypothetical protein